MIEKTKLINKQPLFKKIETKVENEEKSEMEKRKQHLQSLRDLRQPLDFEMLAEHSKRVDELQKYNTEKAKKTQAKQLLELEKSYDYSKFKTKFLDRVIERDTILKEEQEIKDEERAKI